MATAWTQGRDPAVTPMRARRDSWWLFLFLTIVLVPVVVPTGPAESAIVDVVSAIALPIFAASVAVRRRPITVPFLLPVFLMSVGSLIATLNALSPSDAYLAMAQDLYLFAWFIMLVNLLRDGRDLTTFRVMWMWTANAIALYGIFVVMTQGHSHLLDLLRPRGARAISTFYDPNMCANYLVLSLWIVFGLGEEIGRLVRWGSIGLLLLGIVATKSNGGFTALGVGFGVWLLARAWTTRISPAGLAALALLGASLVLGGLWVVRGMGVGEAQLGQVAENSSLGRSGHSSEGRFQIWGQLLKRYARTPAGIGPGNSQNVPLSAEERERPHSYMSKEAHNDYLAYLIERGPLALLGLLLLKVGAFRRVILWWRRRQRQGYVTGGVLVASSLAAMSSMAVHSLTLETLHFRHEWLFLAMVCALDGMVFRARRVEREPAASPLVQPARTRAAAVA
jgi:O-antigen ligase